jgi:6-phosphogluconolactonase
VIEHPGPTVDPAGSQPHQIDLSRDNRFAIASYLGLDKLLVYRFDSAKGTLAANGPPFVQLHPGARPRHFAFHPNYKFLYVLEEAASIVNGFSYDAATGTLRRMATVSTLPEGFKGDNTSAEIRVNCPCGTDNSMLLQLTTLAAISPRMSRYPGWRSRTGTWPRPGLGINLKRGAD